MGPSSIVATATTPVPMATPAMAPFTVTPTASTTTRLVPRATRLRRTPSSSTDATATTQHGTTEALTPTPPLSMIMRLVPRATRPRRMLSSTTDVMVTTPHGTTVSTELSPPTCMATTSPPQQMPRPTIKQKRMLSSSTDATDITQHGTTVSTRLLFTTTIMNRKTRISLTTMSLLMRPASPVSSAMVFPTQPSITPLVTTTTSSQRMLPRKRQTLSLLSFND